MKNNKYVLVSHKTNDTKTFLFRVKRGVKAKVGDVAICNTKYGNVIGFIKETFQSPAELEDALVSRYGGVGEIKEITFAIPHEIYNIIFQTFAQPMQRAKYLVTELDGIVSSMKSYKHTDCEEHLPF